MSIIEISHQDRNIINWSFILMAILILIPAVPTNIALYGPMILSLLAITASRLSNTTNRIPTLTNISNLWGSDDKIESSATEYVDEETVQKYIDGEIDEAEYEKRAEKQLKQQSKTDESSDDPDSEEATFPPFFRKVNDDNEAETEAETESPTSGLKKLNKDYLNTPISEMECKEAVVKAHMEMSDDPKSMLSPEEYHSWAQRQDESYPNPVEIINTLNHHSWSEVWEAAMKHHHSESPNQDNETPTQQTYTPPPTADIEVQTETANEDPAKNGLKIKIRNFDNIERIDILIDLEQVAVIEDMEFTPSTINIDESEYCCGDMLLVEATSPDGNKTLLLSHQLEKEVNTEEHNITNKQTEQ